MILTESIEELQRLMNRVSAHTMYGNLKDQPDNVSLTITIDGRNVERVEQYTNLGVMVKHTNEHT